MSTVSSISSINATFTDWLGVTIKPGDHVIYPAKWKRGGNKTIVLAEVIKLSIERRPYAGYEPVMMVRPIRESHERPLDKRRSMYPVRIKALGSVTVVPKATP